MTKRTKILLGATAVSALATVGAFFYEKAQDAEMEAIEEFEAIAEEVVDEVTEEIAETIEEIAE